MKKSNLKVWDAPVRVLHWLLVLSVAGAWFTRSRLGPLHEYLGYAVAAIAAVRIGWGFVGGKYARFSQFLRDRRATLGYFRSMMSNTAPRYIGHNPLGGWMVLALMTCIGLLSLTGWLYTTDWLWGYGWLANLHAAFGWLLLVLIGLHVSGVLLSSWLHRENLIAAMFSGKKKSAQSTDID